MHISSWPRTLLQLMQEESQNESVVTVAIATDSTTLKCSSSSSINSFSISIINCGSSRSVRINPSEGELDYDDYYEGNTINNSSNRILNNVIFASGRKEEEEDEEEEDEEEEARGELINPVEEWLPITESRKGNMYFCIFHLVSSGLGYQSLALPEAFATLGWAWGLTWLSMAFIWQFYTTWLLTQLHESSGFRYSRYVQLAMKAFGLKLGKLLAQFPIMYLAGGTCTTLLITGGGTMQHLYHILCEDGRICHGKSITTIEWYLVFICLAIVIAQFPNLNSVAWVSLVSAITAMVYCALIWIMSITSGRPSGTKHSLSLKESESEAKSLMNVLSAVGIIALSFRGHNLVLEIQGTLPTSLKEPTNKRMWKGVKISNALIAMCLFPLAIGGYWTYGTLMPNTGMLNTFAQFHGSNGSKLKLAMIYFFLVINSLCAFPVYAMVVFDNLELQYASRRKKPCPWWLRAGTRIFFGGVVFFLAVAVPFLPLLAPLLGGIALPITFVYPCFMWISIKKPSKFGTMWVLNFVLGSLGILLSVLLFIAAIYNLVTKGLSANFFHPIA